MLFQKEAFALCPSPEWSDDPWYLNQDERHFVRNDGIWAIRPGKAEGTIIGGNLGLLDELKGTPYFPDIRDCILFAEHCAEHDAWVFNRNLQSLCLHPDFKRVRALVIGRFEPQNQMNRAQLEEILLSKKSWRACRLSPMRISDIRRRFLPFRSEGADLLTESVLN